MENKVKRVIVSESFTVKEKWSFKDWPDINFETVYSKEMEPQFVIAHSTRTLNDVTVHFHAQKVKGESITFSGTEDFELMAALLVEFNEILDDVKGERDVED